MTEIVTLYGETVDQVCRRVYGSEAGHVEAVLVANPGLAGRPKRLPAGLQIRLPVATAKTSTDPVIKLWY